MQSATATFTPSLLNETGTFSISASGNGYLGFFFRGDEEFTQRCINLCINYGILLAGKVSSFHDGSHYVLTPADRLHSGLKQYFENRILMENPQEILKSYITDEDGMVVDSTWDKEAVNRLAEESLKLFLETKVTYENILQYEGGIQNGLEYGFGTIGGGNEE